jgi:Co/Zn/Cd efflux system component
MTDSDQALRNSVLLVAVLNLAYFVVEFVVGLHIGSASLFADCADFFEDAAVNFLVLAALAWNARRRARTGKVLAIVLLLPALAFVWTLLGKFAAPVPPDPAQLGLTGLGALFVNLFCAYRLARHRRSRESLAKAAYLSARNDALANVGIIGAAVTTGFIHSVWPDIVVGVAIAVMNLDAARAVWRAAVEEEQARA